MTSEEARHILIEAMNYAAYRETDSSLYDSDKNRLFGSEQYNSGRLITKSSPWQDGDFEERMAQLLEWANALNHSVPEFMEAQRLLRDDASIMGRIVRLCENKKAAKKRK